MNKTANLALLFIAFTILYACKHETPAPQATPTETEEVNKSGKEYTSHYVCPMHCAGSGSDSLGVCPVCGMDYVLNDEKNHDGHDHSHDGHNH
jgi:hypothetical protein